MIDEKGVEEQLFDVVINHFFVYVFCKCSSTLLNNTRLRKFVIFVYVKTFLTSMNLIFCTRISTDSSTLFAKSRLREIVDSSTFNLTDVYVNLYYSSTLFEKSRPREIVYSSTSKKLTSTSMYLIRLCL